MAQVQAKVAAKAQAPISKAAVERKKRGEGIFAVVFVDSNGKVSSRATSDTVAVRLDAKAHGHFDMPLADVPQASSIPMVAIGLKQRSGTYVGNHVKEDGSQAIAFAKNVWAEIRAGKVYTRAGEGGGKGKVELFDVKLHADAMRAAREQMVKAGARLKAKKDGTLGAKITAMTDDEYENFILQLETADKKTRKERAAKWMLNKWFKQQFHVLQARSVNTKDVEEVDDSIF